MIEPQNGYTEKSFGSPIIRPEREKPPIVDSVTPEIKEYVASQITDATIPIWLAIESLKDGLAELQGLIEDVGDSVTELEDTDTQNLYVAGTGITIDGFTISATPYTGGDGITISSFEVSVDADTDMFSFSGGELVIDLDECT